MHSLIAFVTSKRILKDTDLTPYMGNFHIGLSDWQHQIYATI